MIEGMELERKKEVWTEFRRVKKINDIVGNFIWGDGGYSLLTGCAALSLIYSLP